MEDLEIDRLVILDVGMGGGKAVFRVVSVSTGGAGGLVAQSCRTLWNPNNCSSPGSSVHRISQEYWSELPFPILFCYRSCAGFKAGIWGVAQCWQ